ncbi:MAG: hypothetical protein BME94_00050 [Methanobacteriales archaeon Met13]
MFKPLFWLLHFLMWSGLKLTAYGITDLLYSTVKPDIIVADEIYSKENSKNVREFLETNTMNQNRISITSDLDEKYKPIY